MLWHLIAPNNFISVFFPQTHSEIRGVKNLLKEFNAERVLRDDFLMKRKEIPNNVICLGTFHDS